MSFSAAGWLRDCLWGAFAAVCMGPGHIVLFGDDGLFGLLILIQV